MQRLFIIIGISLLANTAFSDPYGGILSYFHQTDLYKIASDNYGLMTVMYSGGAGSSWEEKHLFAFINGDFKEIFDTPRNFKFVTKSDGYYDIELTEIDYTTGGSGTLIRAIYKFIGSKYVKQ
jgi:hypothetical protein